MKAEEKVLKRFEELIDQAEEIKKVKEGSSEYDLWKKRVELLLEKVGGEGLYRRYERSFPKWAGGLPESTHRERFLEAVERVKNLLIAAKEDVELFGLQRRG